MICKACNDTKLVERYLIELVRYDHPPTKVKVPCPYCSLTFFPMKRPEAPSA